MSGETILIVEDDWIISENLQNILKGIGYHVLNPITSGEEAIHAVSVQSPDLILMDIGLTGAMNGIETSRRIATMSEIPVIFLSSHAEQAIIEDAKTAMPYGYLIKPVFERDLSVAIEMALNRSLMDRCLRESEERFRSIFQNLSKVAVRGYGMDGTVRYWNQASEHFYGYTIQEAVGRNLMELIIPPEMCKDFQKTIQRMVDAKESEIPASEWSPIRKDGSRLLVFSNHSVLKGSGRQPELFSMDIDLSDYKRIEKVNAALEDQNRQLQKAESLGRMAGAIAHQFNNILGAAIGNIDMALMELSADSDVAVNLTAAMEACHRAADVSSKMLTYLGQAQGKQELMDLSETCLHGLPIIQVVVPNHVTIVPELPLPGPIIRANTNQIHQLLTNLLTNAWESVQEKQGSIRLSVKKVFYEEIPESYRFPVDWNPQNEFYACMEVSDTGCGMTSGDIERIFDPFFSSKFTGRGMGLPVVLGIVRSHLGGITVESEKGIGSVFRVFLPVQDEIIIHHKAKEASAPASEGAGTILLIEDDVMMRSIVQTMLVRLGYRVLVAKEGEEAVEIFKLHRNEIRCVLSDLTMPKMDGWETMAVLRRLSPDIPVILSSGYNEAEVMEREHSEQPNAFLGKPYRINELDQIIRNVLSA